MFIVRESALSSAAVNTSLMRMDNAFLLTSDRSCDLVRKDVLSYDLRLDSLCFALCSGPRGMRRVLELYQARKFCVLIMTRCSKKSIWLKIRVWIRYRQTHSGWDLVVLTYACAGGNMAYALEQHPRSKSAKPCLKLHVTPTTFLIQQILGQFSVSTALMDYNASTLTPSSPPPIIQRGADRSIWERRTNLHGGWMGWSDLAILNWVSVTATVDQQQICYCILHILLYVTLPHIF